MPVLWVFSLGHIWIVWMFNSATAGREIWSLGASFSFWIWAAPRLEALHYFGDQHLPVRNISCPGISGGLLQGWEGFLLGWLWREIKWAEWWYLEELSAGSPHWSAQQCCGWAAPGCIPPNEQSTGGQEHPKTSAYTDRLAGNADGALATKCTIWSSSRPQTSLI